MLWISPEASLIESVQYGEYSERREEMLRSSALLLIFREG